MLPQAEIQRYGGKAAILNHIRERIPEMPIPPYVVKEHGQGVETILPDFELMRKPVIVRSSSPYEYGDFEGIFDSVPDIHDVRSLERAIQQVEKSVMSERAREYARLNGFQVNDVIHAIVQEQSNSAYRGAMMRHPNNPDLIFIMYAYGEGKFQREYDRFLFDERTQSNISGDIPEEDAKFLVEKYKQLESLTGIAEGYSLFVEFGFEPFALYQVRPFKKIQTADFNLPKFDSSSMVYSDLCFGITSPEGIVLPVLRSIGTAEATSVILKLGKLQRPDIKFEGSLDPLLMHDLMVLGVAVDIDRRIDRESARYLAEKLKGYNLMVDAKIGKPYCLVTSSAHREEYDVDLSVPNMKGLVVGEAQYFLVHGLMRLFKKADVTVTVPVLFFEEFYQSAKSLDDKVRIISNGKEAIVLKE